MAAKIIFFIYPTLRCIGGLLFDKQNPKTDYSVAPVRYGALPTDAAANQIAAESSATPGDVKNVLDRYAYYVKENLKKGYAIQLLGFGILNVRFIKSGTVSDETKATSALIKGMVPGFSPSYRMVNGKRIYDLIPEKIALVKDTGNLPAGATGADSGSSAGGGGAVDEEPTV